MKNILKIIDKIEISFLTILITIFAILSGLMKNMLSLYIISFIHEIFHLIACLALKVKIDKFIVLPFGFSLKAYNIEKITSIKQIIIYIAGPLSFFLNIIWIEIFYRYELINFVNYNYLSSINFVMFVVNLLPIVPLDGFNVLKGIMQMVLPYKKALKYTMFISLVAFILFIFVNIITYQPMFTIFLLIEQIKNIILQKEKYKEFLLTKLINKKHKKYRVISDYNMFKDINNYKIENDQFIDDSQIALIELNNTKIKNKNAWFLLWNRGLIIILLLTYAHKFVRITMLHL